MSDLGAWVNKARQVVTEHKDEYGLPVLQEMLSKWEDRKPQLESLEKIGQGYVQEIITGIFMFIYFCNHSIFLFFQINCNLNMKICVGGGSPEDEEQKLIKLVEDYENIGKELKNAVQHLLMLRQLSLVKKELSNLEIICEGYNKWFMSMENHHLDPCRVS